MSSQTTNKRNELIKLLHDYNVEPDLIPILMGHIDEYAETIYGRNQDVKKNITATCEKHWYT